jgi:catechol 2,3-dioxygenase-like lactoylglutathione lyase family enzyme
MRLRHVTIDCADPYELATFWSNVTGWPVSDRRPDGRGWVTLLDPEGNEFCVEREATAS